MHGYFMDIRLYHKAKAVARPFAFNEYKKQIIKNKIDKERKNRVEVKVNYRSRKTNNFHREKDTAGADADTIILYTIGTSSHCQYYT